MTNDTTPSTKADLSALVATMVTKTDLAELTSKFVTKAEVKEVVTSVFTPAIDELKRYIDVMVETMRHDFQDAFRDGYQHLRNRQSELERRVDRLERHASLV